MSSEVDTRLYEELRRQVTRAVARVCPSWLSADRDDVVQVSLLRLHQQLKSGEGSRLTSASYIWKTAFSVTVDEIRRRSRRPETPLDEVAEAPAMADAMPDPERRAISRQLGDGIRACLAGLIDARRAAVVLHLQGHTVREIAALLGSEYKKAENLVYRGMSDLRQCLTAKGLDH